MNTPNESQILAERIGIIQSQYVDTLMASRRPLPVRIVGHDASQGFAIGRDPAGGVYYLSPSTNGAEVGVQISYNSAQGQIGGFWDGSPGIN